MAKLKMNIDKADFLNQLGIMVEFNRKFNSHFAKPIRKPFYGFLTDERFDIQNTPRILNISTFRITGSISDQHLTYKTFPPYWWLAVIFTLISLLIEAVSFMFNPFPLGMAFFGFGVTTNILIFIPFFYNRYKFLKLIYEINDGG